MWFGSVGREGYKVWGTVYNPSIQKNTNKLWNRTSKVYLYFSSALDYSKEQLFFMSGWSS
jgi:hypothetical protein